MQPNKPCVTSIFYDMDVLRSYVTDLVKDGERIIILGDRQPVSALADDSSSSAASSPMESFLLDFLCNFLGGAS
jgi:hypothetical protein